MRYLSFPVFLLLFFFAGRVDKLSAQPVLNTLRTAAGLRIYQDFKKKDLFYYAPGDLKLATEADGRPVFQLLAMRYTGTACRADQGDAHFTNGVQFSVKMEAVKASDLEEAKKQLGLGKTVKMRPMTIRNLQSFLVTPTGENSEGRLQYERVGDGSLQSIGPVGNSNPNTYWSERTFNLKLDKYEAQLLWDQVEKGRLAISFGYAFYADVIPGGGEVAMQGSRELLEHFKELETAGPDTSLTSRVIYANAFSFEVDVKRWPDLAKKVDINEGLPPAYAALEVRCYDFANLLRPDMALKQVEIEATAVNGRPVSVQARFSRSQSDQHTQSIFFPFAVRMDQPMQYRITETTLEGVRTSLDWTTVNPCEGLIDITTPADENRVGKYRLEVESDTSLLAGAGIEALHFRVFYYLGEKVNQQELVLSINDFLPLKELHFLYNKEKPALYQVEWIYQDGRRQITEPQMLDQDYYFLAGPKE